MKKIFVLILLLVMPVVSHAAETLTERPHWSLAFKGGLFVPDISNWATYYGRRDTSEFGGSLAYKLSRRIEVGIQGTYLEDKGKGLAPLHGTTGGSVTYQLFPVDAFILVRGVFSEKQVLVPYVGGGWTRIYYKEEVQYQSTARGFADGYHGRAGLQLLLDGIDTSASTNMYLDYGIFHTYFFVETEYSRVMADTTTSGTVNIGGTSWFAGLLFEF